MSNREELIAKLSRILGRVHPSNRRDDQRMMPKLTYGELALLQSDASRIERLENVVAAVSAAMLNGGDGVEGDFGWNITALNKARPLIRALLLESSK